MTPRQTLRETLEARKPLTVGAIADSSAFQSDLTGCDVVELRLDSLGTGEDVLSFARTCPLPLLITARGKAEGGQSDWDLGDRARAYREFLPMASAIDIELRDFDALDDIVSAARDEEVILVGSYHDFSATPNAGDLRGKLNEKADLHKFALMATSADCIRRHLDLFDAIPDLPLSLMGMGPLGAAARPLMAKAGSLLNYGFLGATPTAPNQWPAGLLQQALSV
ncbi:MAG: type I 3-dehydroquinate dehydratase [Akkermansiaceae bacterium]